MELIEPLGHHELFLVILQLTVLLFVARVLGEAFSSIGQPAVVGELLAGVVLGPSLLGVVVPGAYESLFVVSESQFHLLEIISWLGLIMLLLVTGFETDIDLVISKGRTALLLSLGGILVPFVTGFALGWFLPSEFIVSADDRLVFSLFVATAMSISAIPVIAKILLELDVIRRDIGQLILAAGMVDDTIGWILLATVAGLARTGVADLDSAAVTIVSVLAFLGAAFTIGRRIIADTIRWVDNVIGGDIAMISTVMLFTLAAGALTQYMGLEAILGAFVVGVLAGQVKRFSYRVRHVFEAVTLAIFAPLFFAIAGLRMDVTVLADPLVFGVGLVVLSVACIGKFGGIVSVSGLAGLSKWEGITIGGGMNARGAMEIIVATIGLGLGILTTSMYSIIVVVAIVTSLMAPAIMRWSIPKIEMGEAERKRIERERYLQDSFVNNLDRVLLPTRGTADTQYAARLLSPLFRNLQTDLDLLCITPSTETRGSSGGVRDRIRRFVTRLGDRRGDGSDRNRVNRKGHPDSDETERVFSRIEQQLGTLSGETRRLVRETDGSAAESILETAAGGYDLVVLGERTLEGSTDASLFSPTVDRVVQETPCPAMVVSASGVDGREPTKMDEPIERILLPTIGTQASRHAAEIAFTIALEERALVEVVHVVTSHRSDDRFVARTPPPQEVEIGERIVDREAELGRQLGANVVTTVLFSDSPGEELVGIADRTDADAVIMGSNKRPMTRRAFFGPNVEDVLTNAPCPVVVLSSP
ncbi:cation:proton antiporter domain-containing protein [Halostagnicola kamekurae]|uniref:Kef-type K+ transport system, membrane component KefB n=1 Tax=Halostagnicola kamekurae TaxID=619731 RepID=A0A1I6UDR1_9EURY|nr:cation:proton antiporter [Halostagnicola kamekurae]SFS99582.1 Kef-type K+ transport system, membrane component KefB [Halostagnicola kamekurae]